MISYLSGRESTILYSLNLSNSLSRNLSFLGLNLFITFLKFFLISIEYCSSDTALYRVSCFTKAFPYFKYFIIIQSILELLAVPSVIAFIHATSTILIMLIIEICNKFNFLKLKVLKEQKYNKLKETCTLKINNLSKKL